MAKLLKSNKNFDFYLEDFMMYCNMNELSRKTMNSYESTLNLFFKYLQEEKSIEVPQDVSKEDIEDYIIFTKERGKYSYVSDEKTVGLNHPQNRVDFGKQVSDCTINNYLRNIKVFFNYCSDKRFIRKNPVDKVKFIKTKRKMKDEITDGEYKALIKNIDITIYSEYRDYTIINLIFDTGMRLSETLNLKLEDINLEEKTILIPAEINKGKRDRYVFFSNAMYMKLRKWLQYKDRYSVNDIHLFPTKGGNIITASGFGRNFREYVKRAGISKQITAHCLRNNFSKRFLLSGGDIFMLSKILGHSSVTVTEKAYLDVNKDDIKKSYQRYSPLENMKR